METDVAMDLCTMVQAEEYAIHVEESTNFYTHLRFSLLASTWFPRPFGVCLWSVLHMLLVLYEVLMLLVIFATVFVLAVLIDALIVSVFIYGVLVTLIGVITAVLVAVLVISIVVALVLLWLVITCKCCTKPPQSQDPQPAPVVEVGAAATDGPCGFLKSVCKDSFTLKFANHVILVSFPYRRGKLGDLCREIVLWYDIIVV